MDEREFSSIHIDETQFSTPSADKKHPDVGGEEQDDVAWLPEAPSHYRAIKRTIDVIGSLLMIILMAPMFLIIALAIKLTSKGPVLFKQQRIGYRGKPFTFLKFRSMYADSANQNHLDYISKLIAGRFGPVGEQGVSKVANDPRITPVGRFLRRTSIDEIPQMWNVLRGDMSLVGPRTAFPYEIAAYQRWHKQRLSSKPGITGLWQVEGRSSTSFDSMVKLDIAYIGHPSILEDLRILFSTPIAVIRSDKAF
jgi:lipopolysaccharide/colanic/teichoic acid biosynthesis glycosyltransferase